MEDMQLVLKNADGGVFATLGGTEIAEATLLANYSPQNGMILHV